METVTGLRSRGFELDLNSESFGELLRSDNILNDTDALRRRLAEEGYLYIPGFFPRDLIQAARSEFLQRIHAFGGLDPACPVDAAVSSGKLAVPSKGFTADNAPLNDVVFSERIMDFYTRLLGGPCRHYDHVWTRVVGFQQGTPPHCDLVYMGRGTHDVMTAWIPYGVVPLELGGLMMLEKSHKQQERLRKYLEGDVDTYCSNRGPYVHKGGALSSNPVTLREKLGGRWLTAEFQMGDLVTFGMKMVHGSLDNSTNRYRLSSDTRYQLASEPIDHRWVGEDTQEYADKNRVGKIC